MEIPKGVCIEEEDGTIAKMGKYVIQLVNNLYGQKQAGWVWNQHLIRSLKRLGFVKSRVDECVFYFRSIIFLVYTDDTIFMGPNKKEMDYIIKLLGSAFRVQEKGDVSDYLGIKISKTNDGKTLLTQPHFIDSILHDLGLDRPAAKSRTTPALSTKVLDKYEDGEAFDRSFHYRGVIGKMNFLEKSTRPELACAAHQCARFCTGPKKSHAEAVKRIGRYLLATKDKVIILDPNGNSFDCWIDASHAGEWKRKDAMNDPTTAKSRIGYAITFTGCSLIWASKLQTKITLSSTDAKYIALSSAMREVLPLLALMKEAKKQGVPVHVKGANIHCKIFEDNAGAIKLAKVPKMRPWTKHMNIKYHHFRQHVESGLLSLHYVSTEKQLADMFTKNLSEDLFVKHRKKLIGWQTIHSERGSVRIMSLIGTSEARRMNHNLMIQAYSEIFAVHYFPIEVQGESIF